MVNLKQDNVEKLQSQAGKLIEQFFAKVGRKNKKTEKAYRGDVNRFIKLTYKKTVNTVTLNELDSFDEESFVSYIGSFENVKNTTINRHISSIKEMYAYLKAKKGGLKSDITYMELIEVLPSDSKSIEYMTIETVKQYHEEAGKEAFNAKQKQRLIRLAADQGIRLSALLELTWGDFIPLPEENGVLITGYDKRNKKFEKLMSFETYDYVLGIKEDGVDKVFSKLSTKTVADMMNRIKNNLGYDDRNYSFHSLRKAAGTHAHRVSGGDMLEVQRVLEHGSIKNSELYVARMNRKVTGMFSTQNFDKEAYKKVSHEELLETLDELGYDFLHILNSKIQQRKDK